MGLTRDTIKIPVLLPLGLAILILLASSITAIYCLQHNNIEAETFKHLYAVQSLFQERLAEEARLLNGLLDFIEKDKNLQHQWLAQDRDQLLQLATPVFEDIHSKYDVTHFYFHRLDRICFLRIHNPPRFGDYIGRFTLDKAVRNKKSSWGIELGPLGTFTLRIVHSWFIDDKLVGYIEIGKEIEHITPMLKDVLGVEIIFTIDKSFLNRQGWEEGMKMLGRKGNWNLLPDFVIIDSTVEDIPQQLCNKVPLLHTLHKNTLYTVSIGNRTYQSAFIQLTDAGNREVGDIIVLKDITESRANLRNLSLIMILICAFIGATIFALFYFYINRIEHRLTIARRSIESEIEKRKEIENELRQHRNHLEVLVQKRTSELQTTNVRLEQEVNVRKKAEETLELLNKELESTVTKLNRSNRELCSFAYITAHDLKSPLRAICILADWLLTGYSDKFDQQGKEKLELLTGRAKRMSRLIDSILEYTEIGLDTEQKTRVDVNSLINKIIASLNPPENIEIKIENDLPSIQCNENNLTKVFMCLLSNSIRYMDKPKGRISVGCTEENGYWKFSVADNGQGVEEKYFEKIFQVFQTLSLRDETESTGIGLPIVKKVVELYDGKVWIESKPGQGSTFFFTLPKQKVEMKTVTA